MKIALITVGKIKEPFYTKAIQEYSKRLSSYCSLEIYEVADEKTPEGASGAMEDKIRQTEGGRILRLLKDRDHIIALAIKGSSYSSEDFASHMEKLSMTGCGRLVFIIGGSLGLSKDVLSRAGETLSFSQFTFPHQLMRVILLEQIYRSFRIRKGQPYHK